MTTAVEIQDRIVDYMLKTGDPAYFTIELAEKMGMPLRHARLYLYKLQKAGRIEGKTRGTGNSQRIWWIKRGDDDSQPARGEGPED